MELFRILKWYLDNYGLTQFFLVKSSLYLQLTLNI